VSPLQTARARLERQWAVLAALGGVLVAGAAALGLACSNLEATIRRIGPVLVVTAWFFLRLRSSLDLNHPPGDPALRPTLGAANLLTIARAALTACLAGFLLPETGGAAGAGRSWLPGLVYLLAVALDAVDGHVARGTQNVTCLGAQLDTQIDALGLLLAGLLLVASAKAPWPYLGVGAGFYFLQAAVGLRRRAGLPVGRVTPRPGARWLAGCEMVFAALALMPVLSSEATRPAAWVMTLAMGFSLGLDWRIVCGRAKEDAGGLGRAPALLAGVLARRIPLFLRTATATGWVLMLFSAPSESGGEAAIPLRTMALAASALCAIGVAARAAAMLLSFLGALWLVPAFPGSAAALTLMASLALMLTGAGHPRIWQPEDRWLIGRGNAPGGP
jgi:CDP-diacylglycerol--glycerol-3-phosphate 3-phosphatidyltransferase